MTSQTSETSRIFFWSVILSMGMMTGACSWISKGESAFDAGVKDRGVASWYGEQFHGRQAANGERFDMNSLTAAHRTMPLGSVVRVVNLENGKVVHVRINDRGPYVDGRILDLSRSAAGRLGMAEGGLSKVQVEIVGDRRLDWLIPSDARPLISVSLLVMDELLDTVESRAGTARPPDRKVVPPVRFHQADAWISRRGRRMPAILAADHPAHTELTALVQG